MSAVVAVAVEPPVADPSAARKRRREILTSQRQSPEAFAVTSAALATPVTSDDEETGPAKKCRRVSDFTEEIFTVSPIIADVPTSSGLTTIMTTTKKKSTAKKPQMKYDPDVPMTKEEAAVWRREQRRKRNRESAALSRQRQRDRIAELEVEVTDWKNKVDSIMSRIKTLEDASGIDSKALVPAMAPEIADLDLAGLAADLQAATAAAAANNTNTSVPSTFVSPPVSPGHASWDNSPAEVSPVAPSSILSTVDAVVDHVLGGGVFEQEHSDKMISRHAAS